MESFVCRHCGRTCKNANSLRNHERLCKLNPNRDEHALQVMAANVNKWNANAEHIAWNKGKTKETDERVAKIAAIQTGRPNLHWKGRKHTDETKRKISETQKSNYKGISRYATVREQRKSFAEEYFETIFTDAEIQYHVDRYFLDFAWPKSKIYIEIDGEQHYEDQGVIQHDKDRTVILAKQGWRLLKRIRWAEFQKLSFEEKENEIFRLKQTLKIQNS